MKRLEDALRLRVYINSLQKSGHIPLYEVVVLKAREFGLGGATVFRGHTGFGQSGVLQKKRTYGISEDLSIMIDIIDTPEKINAFIPILRELVDNGRIEQTPVRMIRYST